MNNKRIRWTDGDLGLAPPLLKRRRKICVVHFSELKKTILENQRVIRIVAASWVKKVLFKGKHKAVHASCADGSKSSFNYEKSLPKH